MFGLQHTHPIAMTRLKVSLIAIKIFHKDMIALAVLNSIQESI